MQTILEYYSHNGSTCIHKDTIDFTPSIGSAVHAKELEGDSETYLFVVCEVVYTKTTQGYTAIARAWNTGPDIYERNLQDFTTQLTT